MARPTMCVPAIRSFVYREYVPGDVNGDGEVNIADVNAIIGYILGANVPFHPRLDVNSDGEVNIADINAVITLILSC